MVDPQQPPPHPPVPAPLPGLPAPAAHPAQRFVDPRRRSPWVIPGALLLLAMLAVGVMAWRHHHRATAATAAAHAGPPPPTITVGTARQGDITISIDAIGTVTPERTITIVSQVTGTIQAVRFREGQLVAKGDPLVEIDPTPFRALVAESQGALLRDQAALLQAQHDLARYTSAAARGAVARQTVDDQTQLVAQDQGAVVADQGTLAYNQSQLAYCHITAPIAGRVGLRLVDPGNTVFAGGASALVVITQLQPTTVVFNVAEDDLPDVQAQLSTSHSLLVECYDRTLATILDRGQLSALDNLIDTTTGTLKLRATFPNRGLSLFPNQFVNTRLLLRTLHQAILIPTAAVQHNGSSTFVYLLANHIVHVHPVTVLTGNERETAVTGIERGAQLALSGFDRLEDGVSVTVRDHASHTAQAGAGSGTGAEAGPGGATGTPPAHPGGRGAAADAGGQATPSATESAGAAGGTQAP